MAFALTVLQLIETMHKPGCPICRREKLAARESIESFLWESVNDPTVRTKMQASYGFCPEHTRLLVAAELSNTGRVPGVNIIYEQLARQVRKELQTWQRDEKSASRLHGWLARLGLGHLAGKSSPVLQPEESCMICEAARQTALNSLITLFTEIDRRSPDALNAYQASAGLCLVHLRMGLTQLSRTYPEAASWLVEDTSQRLDRQSARMQEYIRKNNWEYREEKITPEEGAAWRETLTFFTGYPEETFTHKMDE